jgi:hypothetical protein
MDMYKNPEDFDTSAALAFSREQAPAGALAIMLAIQDRIADASLLVSNMATAKDPRLSGPCSRPAQRPPRTLGRP